MLRVFYDRLVDDTDRLWVGQKLADLAEAHFKEKITRVLGVEKVGGFAASGRVKPHGMHCPASFSKVLCLNVGCQQLGLAGRSW